jgi:hypothetical protein
MKKKFPIGDNEMETESMFDNMWTDTYVRDMNYLLTYVSDLNRFSSMQVRVAEELCFSGIAVTKTYEYGGNQIFTNVESENFWWDRTGMQYDLSDCEYMGDIHYLVPSEIYEKNPNLSKEDKEAIERFSRMYSKFGASTNGNNVASSQLNKYELGGRVPIFNAYWKDGEEFEYGYVMDKLGYPYFTRINFKYEGEEKPRYTDKDLIEVKTERARKILKGKKSKKIFREVIRYCSFVPKEILCSASEHANEQKNLRDVIVDWGALPFQETENIDYIRAKFPFKAYCWAYVDGETVSPIDVAIDPQRFINRVLSIAENQVNNSGGVNLVYDGSMLDPQGGEAEFLRNIKDGKPVKFLAKGRGMQNAVMPYDNTVKQGTLGLFNLAQEMRGFLQASTGVNDALQGQQVEADQLVGVTQLMIQRGSLIQEPFYNAIREIFIQQYESIATLGKKIYSDNERELSFAAGDEGVKVFRITKGMNMEDFSVFVKFANTDDALAAAANQELLQFKQLGMLDDSRIAQLWGRSSPDEVGSALRSYDKEKKELARAQNKQNQEHQQQLAEMTQQQMAAQKHDQYEAIARQDIGELTNHKNRLQEIYAKALGKVAASNPVAQAQIIGENQKMTSQRVV